MTRSLVVMVSVLSGACALVAGSAGTCQALPPFKKAFDDRYVKPSTDEAFKESAKKAGCNLCHVDKKPKKEQNAYGSELAKLIEGDAQHRLKDAKAAGGEAGETAEKEKIMKELEKAFDEVEKKDAPTGDKYGDRLKASKLPLEAAK